MKMSKTVFALAVGLAVAVQAQTKAAEVVPQVQQRKVALIIQNHAAPGAEIPMMALQDALTAKLSGRGFQVINPYNALGVNQNRSVEGEKTPATSAVALARGLGADGVVTASVIELLDSPLGNPVVLHQFSVRITISLADAGTGATICGETLKTTSPKYTNNQAVQNYPEILGDLLYAAADECATKLEANPSVRAWRPTLPPAPPANDENAANPSVRATRPTLLQPPKPLPPATILDRKVDVLMREMLLNPQFVKNYEESKARQDGRTPVVVLGGIENQTGNAALKELIDAAGEHFRVKLFNSKLFEVKDDAEQVKLAKRIVGSANSPLEDGDLISALKQHGSPDFFVTGDLKKITDLDGITYYKFRLAIHNLATGKIVWEGLETFNSAR